MGRDLPSHGTRARYRRDCRCPECREANRLEKQAEREQRRLRRMLISGAAEPVDVTQTGPWADDDQEDDEPAEPDMGDLGLTDNTFHEDEDEDDDAEDEFPVVPSWVAAAAQQLNVPLPQPVRPPPLPRRLRPARARNSAAVELRRMQIEGVAAQRLLEGRGAHQSRPMLPPAPPEPEPFPDGYPMGDPGTLILSLDCADELPWPTNRPVPNQVRCPRCSQQRPVRRWRTGNRSELSVYL
jgi:hypothetical protein